MSFHHPVRISFANKMLGSLIRVATDALNIVLLARTEEDCLLNFKNKSTNQIKKAEGNRLLFTLSNKRSQVRKAHIYLPREGTRALISKGPFRSSPVVFSLRSQAIKSPDLSIFKLLNITVKTLIKKKEESHKSKKMTRNSRDRTFLAP